MKTRLSVFAPLPTPARPSPPPHSSPPWAHILCVRTRRALCRFADPHAVDLLATGVPLVAGVAACVAAAAACVAVAAAAGRLSAAGFMLPNPPATAVVGREGGQRGRDAGKKRERRLSGWDKKEGGDGDGACVVVVAKMVSTVVALSWRAVAGGGRWPGQRLLPCFFATALTIGAPPHRAHSARQPYNGGSRRAPCAHEPLNHHCCRNPMKVPGTQCAVHHVVDICDAVTDAAYHTTSWSTCATTKKARAAPTRGGRALLQSAAHHHCRHLVALAAARRRRREREGGAGRLWTAEAGRMGQGVALPSDKIRPSGAAWHIGWRRPAPDALSPTLRTLLSADRPPRVPCPRRSLPSLPRVVASAVAGGGVKR